MDACEDKFKVFIQCAMDNSEYYEPFLNMLLGEPDADSESTEGKGKDVSSSFIVDLISPTSAGLFSYSKDPTPEVKSKVLSFYLKYNNIF